MEQWKRAQRAQTAEYLRDLRARAKGPEGYRSTVRARKFLAEWKALRKVYGSERAWRL